jgi:large subunit ribosomal protein L6
MSRIGFKPVALPAGVTCVVNGGLATIKGPKGEVNVLITKGVSVSIEDGKVEAKLIGEDTPNHGTVAANLHNAVKGVTEGWKKELEINGTGYRAQMKGNTLVMFLGYSHDIIINPVGKFTKITVPDETHVVVEGCDKQEVGQTAALIYDSHRPDPYGQKGVHFKGQHLIKKVGKRAAATTGAAAKK